MVALRGGYVFSISIQTLTELRQIAVLTLKRAPVAHAWNPSYSGGKDQEDLSLKPAWGNSSRDPISKRKPFMKKGLVEWLKV
jgi:hypothetical protein